jgi:SAM-dependent methyltransferase
LELHKVPQLFDYPRFKSRLSKNHATVMKLQTLLEQALQSRIELFSRKFPVKVFHNFSTCQVQDLSQDFNIEIDPEVIPFKNQSLDLALSAGPIMFTNDIPGILKQWYAALKPGGVFMAAFFGENSLIELKDCFLSAEEKLNIPHTLRFSPTIATKDAGMLMQRAEFHSPTADRTHQLFQVQSLSEILNSLKAMGGNILHERSTTRLSKEFLKVVEAEYHKRYASETKLNVTIDIVCMTGWAIELYTDERIHQQTTKSIGYI